MTKNTPESTPPKKPIGKEALALSLFGCFLFLLLSFVSFDPSDIGFLHFPGYEQTRNLCGQLGAHMVFTLFYYLGNSIYLLFACLIILVFRFFHRSTLSYLPLRLLSLYLSLIASAGFLATFPGGPDFIPSAGGIWGAAITSLLSDSLAVFGTRLVCVLVTLIAFLAALDISLSHSIKAIVAFLKAHMPEMPQRPPALAGASASTAKTAAPQATEEQPKSDLAIFDSAATATKKRRGFAMPEPTALDDSVEADPSPLIMPGSEEAKLEAEKKAKKKKRGRKKDPVVEEESLDNIVPPEEAATWDATNEVNDSDGPQVSTSETDASPEDSTDTASAASFAEADESVGNVANVSVSTSSNAGETLAVEAEVIEEPPAPRQLKINSAVRRKKKKKKPEPPKQLNLDGYQLPTLELLNEGEEIEETDTSGIEEKAAIIEQVLKDFRIESQIVQVNRGPSITQFELKIASAVKVGRVSTLSDNIKMALKSTSLRVVAPIPGKDTIGIEIPNDLKRMINLKPLIENNEDVCEKHFIPIVLGEDETGNAIIPDLAKLPHLLIAGSTGSGKSVCINSIIQSILLLRRPDEVKLILIDPKSVEMADYQRVPHLMTPVVSDMSKAAAVLDWAVKKMEDRYEYLARIRCRNIADFNELGEETIRERLESNGDFDKDKDTMFKMPYIVIIIDELADLMMVSANEVEGAITRLAQKSRAVGIHIILATQRPSTDVITGLIKANLPARIAFKVISAIDSRTILDQKGADQLIGKGDMLYMPPNDSRLYRSQGVFVTDDEIKRVVEVLEGQAQPVFSDEIARAQSAGDESDDAPAAGRGEGPSDELFDDAVQIILTNERGSVSLLQRKMQIGYTRAARLVDMMAEEGILGDHQGAKAREILITLEEWQAMKRAEEAAALAEEEDDEYETYDEDSEVEANAGSAELADLPAVDSAPDITDSLPDDGVEQTTSALEAGIISDPEAQEELDADEASESGEANDVDDLADLVEPLPTTDRTSASVEDDGPDGPIVSDLSNNDDTPVTEDAPAPQISSSSPNDDDWETVEENFET